MNTTAAKPRAYVGRHRAPAKRGKIASRAIAMLTAACSCVSVPAFAQPANPDDSQIAAAEADFGTSSADVTRLVGTLAETERRLSELENTMGFLREQVNKANVDFDTAQAEAEKARAEARAAKDQLNDTQAQMDAAQATLDEISRSAYRLGGQQSILALAGKAQGRDNLDRQTYLRVNAQKQREVLDELDRLRTQKANQESSLRQAQKVAEQKEQAAEQARQDAERTLAENSAQLDSLRAEHSQLQAEHNNAQLRLDVARGNVAALRNQRAEFEQYQQAKAEKAVAESRSAEAEAAQQQAAADSFAKREDAAAAQQRAAEAAAQVAALEAEAAQPAETSAPTSTPVADQPANTPEAPAPAAPTSTSETAAPAAPSVDAHADAEAEQKLAAAKAEAEAAARAAAEAEAAARAAEEEKARRDREAEDAKRFTEAAVGAAALAAATLVAATAQDHPEVAGVSNNPEVTADALIETLSKVTSNAPAATTTQGESGTADGTGFSESDYVVLDDDTSTQAPANNSGNAADKNAGNNTGANTEEVSTGNPQLDQAINVLNQLSNLFSDDDYVTLDDQGTSKGGSQTVVATGSRAQRIEAVIARAESQIGVPYAWGGGDANGPTKGIRDGGVADSYGDYNKIGFDCSGLTLYAFAAAGISLPHYTGYQYNHGTKVDINDIQRGDLLFWGPAAEYHVAIYLGDGMMIEAPNSGSTVQKSPVRYSGMSPYAVRLI